MLKKELNAVANLIDDIIRNDGFANSVQPAYLKDATIDYPLRAGKRIRPALLMWSCGLFNGNLEQTKYAAAAVEIYHNWTLVHDDIIDNDNFRRGKPSTHNILADYATNHLKTSNPKKFGIDLGILTGDIQQAWATNMLLKSPTLGVNLDVVLSLSRRLQEFVNVELISGEALDVEFSYLLPSQLQEDRIEEMLIKKTGVLLQFCAESGVAIALNTPDLNNEKIKLLGEFASLAGLVFQLKDDWLGIFGDEKKLGKPICSDIIEGKNTLLITNCLENVTNETKNELLSYFNKERLSNEDISKIQSIIRKSGADKYILDKANKIADKAKLLLPTTQNNKYKHLLCEMLSFFINRKF